MKKVLITLAIVGGISLIGIASVSALSNDHHKNYNHYNYVDDYNLTTTNCPRCGNYIDEDNDGYCDNCTNNNISNVTENHHHNNHHGHH